MGEKGATAAKAVMWDDQDPSPEPGTQDGWDSRLNLGQGLQGTQDLQDPQGHRSRMAPRSLGHLLGEARTPGGNRNSVSL